MDQLFIMEGFHALSDAQRRSLITVIIAGRDACGFLLPFFMQKWYTSR